MKDNNVDPFAEIEVLASKLSQEEFEFCELYLQNMTSPVAMTVARALPYEDNPNMRGKHMMANPKVLNYLDMRRAMIRRAFITKDDVMLRLYQTLDKCTQPIAAIDKRGQPTGEYTFDSKGAIKILELLSKHFNIIDANKDAAPAPVIPNINVNKDDIEIAMVEFDEQY